MIIFYNIKKLSRKQVENKFNSSKEIELAPIYELYFENKIKFKEELQKLTKQIENNKEITKKELIIVLNVKNIENSLFGHISRLNSQYKTIIATGTTVKINRFLLESTQIDYLLDPQDKAIRDATHHFNSGLNQVLSQIAKEKKKKVLFSTNSFIFHEKIDYREIGKIQQNIQILEKKKIQYDFIQIIDSIEEIIKNTKTILSFFKRKK